MDFIRNQKQKKNEKEPGLEKSHLAKVTRDTKKNDRDSITIDGEVILMAEDLLLLPEADYSDPKVQATVQENQEQIVQKYGKLSWEEAEKLGALREEIQQKHPDLTREQAINQAWDTFRALRK